MPNPNFDRDKAARVLVDASILGDRRAAEKHGVAPRTVRHYRQRLESEPDFAALCLEKQKLQDENWASGIPSTLVSSIYFLKVAAQSADPKSPKAIEAIASALQTLADVWFSHEILKHRLEQESQR